MTSYEIISVLLSTGHRIDAQWALFLSIHMAILGAVIYVDRPLNRVEKSFAIFFYVVFGVCNFLALIQQQLFYEHASHELLRTAGAKAESEIISYFEMVRDANLLGRRRVITITAHILAGAMVIASIALDGRFKSAAGGRAQSRG